MLIIQLNLLADFLLLFVDVTEMKNVNGKIINFGLVSLTEQDEEMFHHLYKISIICSRCKIK